MKFTKSSNEYGTFYTYLDFTIYPPDMEFKKFRITRHWGFGHDYTTIAYAKTVAGAKKIIRTIIKES